MAMDAQSGVFHTSRKQSVRGIGSLIVSLRYFPVVRFCHLDKDMKFTNVRGNVSASMKSKNRWRFHQFRLPGPDWTLNS